MGVPHLTAQFVWYVPQIGQIHLGGSSTTYKTILHEPFVPSENDVPGLEPEEEDCGIYDEIDTPDACATFAASLTGGKASTAGKHLSSDKNASHRLPSCVSSHVRSSRPVPFCFLLRNMRIRYDLREEFAFKVDGRPNWKVAISAADASGDLKMVGELEAGLIDLLGGPGPGPSSTVSKKKPSEEVST